MFMPHARSDFCVGFWTSPDILQTQKLSWLRETLEGIANMHAMGIMHRDIRPKNMLIMSVFPPRAALCDYGKAIEAESSNVTTLGPIHTLAPEVWTVSRDGPYTATIDLWAFGYTIAELLGYTVAKHPGPDRLQRHNPYNPPITRNRHAAILDMLGVHAQNVSEDEELVDLCTKLLTWRPRDRWSASQALEHRCWTPLARDQPKDKAEQEQGQELQETCSEITAEEPLRSKRAQLKDPRSKPRGW
jgi:serine/threonine protein kinase